MSYTNNIYIPYIQGFHDEKKFIFYENYYKKLGFNVKKIELDKEKEINYNKIIKKILENDEEVFIFIDYLIIPHFAINQAIEVSTNNKCIVLPFNKTYLINDKEQMDKIISSLTSDEILESFYYSDSMICKVWPLGGAWVIHKDSFNDLTKPNDLTETLYSYDFHICYLQYIFNNLIFVESDSYKYNPDSASVDENILFLHKQYLTSLTNLFGIPTESYIYKNQVLEKIEPEVCQEFIFNIDKYFSDIKYI